MTAMACKWNGLFNVGEDFDDEDLLDADWPVTSEPSPAIGPAAQSSSLLRAPTTPVSHNPMREALERSLEPGSCDAPGQSAGFGLRGLRTPYKPPSLTPPLPPPPSLRPPVAQQTPLPPSCAPQAHPPPLDEFDDWDVDLEDLDEGVAPAMGAGLQTGPPAPLPRPPAWPRPSDEALSPAKRLRPSVCATGAPRGFGAAVRALPCTPTPAVRGLPPRPPLPAPCPSPVFLPAPRPSPGFPRGVSVPPCPVTPQAGRAPPQWQSGSAATPRFSGRPTSGSLFQAVSPSPGPSPSLTPCPLHTPVLTNHLVQLVSAANKTTTPQRPRLDSARPKTRRFPGPAGVLPQQLSGRSLDDIIVAVPQTPAHGAVARLRSEVPSSQASEEEEEFSGGAWAAMKAEMGLDEKNPSCFLHSYSVVMVLRKAALRQLVKNKVPNMAVVLKSILHTHADAKAVFRDPTGEMQGTVHRRLLEDRLGELKTGAVLLLKQVGVFSPSHRNHYLNVTPSNLLRIYPPDGVLPAPAPLSRHALEPVVARCAESSRPAGGALPVPVSQMELRFEEEEEEEESWSLGVPANPAANGLSHAGTEDTAWDADDLDELLGELPVESYGL